MKKTLLLSISILSISLMSCKKEGCTDFDATNYDADAKKENGTCIFEGSNVFWYDEDVATFLVSDDAVSLFYYVNDQLIGSSAAGVYWTSAPDCGQDASITVTKNLGNIKTQSFSYEVIDQSGWTYWSGTLNFNANTCITVELD
ncbi:MAG: hypothetical protein GQ574_27285 [Crocinitomix sp.]|nr:hypothetical protein [Crocinitomix sp.]